MIGFLLRTLWLVSLLLLTACDPAFVKSFRVAAPEARTTSMLPLSDIDALAEVYQFRRTESLPEHREQVEADGHDLIAYYVRAEPNSSNTESLSVVQRANKHSLRVDLFAFVALREPDTLHSFREALFGLLCDEGYVVEGREDCGAWSNRDLL